MERRPLSYLVALAEKLHFRRAALRLRASTAAGETTVRRDHRADAEALAALTLLAYELLDAHTDTAQLADGLAYDRSWAAHLDYLRALQRTGRATLARTASAELPSSRWAGHGSIDVR